MVGVIASAIAIIVFISGKHSLPEFQDSAVALREQTVIASSSPPLSPAVIPKSPDYFYVRVFNCDDGGRAFLNDTLVTEVGFGDDSGWINVTDRLKPGLNKITFQV